MSLFLPLEPGEPFPPDFTEVPKNVAVEEGSIALFTCRVTGAPLPTVTWFKDNKQVESAGRFKVRGILISLKTPLHHMH